MTALIQVRENNESINRQVHSIRYVKDSHNISIAMLKKKIIVWLICARMKKMDDKPCVLIRSILLKIKKHKYHVRVPKYFKECEIPSFQVLHGLKSTQ
jgi:hypothetical protein